MQTSDTITDFQAMAAQLQKLPRSIEEFVEMKHFALGVPENVEVVRAHIARDVGLFDLIESFRHRLTLDDVRRRWQIAAAPKAILEEDTHKMKLLQGCEAEFLKQLASQQVDVASNLDDFEQTIELFRHQPSYRDVERLEEIIDIVENVNGRLQAADQQ